MKHEKVEVKESVRIAASAVFTFPTDEEHRIIGRAFRSGKPDAVLETITISRGTGDPNEWPQRRFEWGAVSAKGRLILKSGELGNQLVDVVTDDGGFRSHGDDERVQRVQAIVDECRAEFADRVGSPREVFDRVSAP